LKFGRRHRSPPPSTPSLSFLPSKLQRVVRKQTPPFFISLPSRAPHRHSPPARPHGRRTTAATLFTCASVWLSSQGPKLHVGVFPTQIRGRERNVGRRRRPRRRAPPPPAQAPPPSRTRAWLAIGLAINSPDLLDLRVKPASIGQPGRFL
jgi:hypothetical protein